MSNIISERENSASVLKTEVPPNKTPLQIKNEIGQIQQTITVLRQRRQGLINKIGNEVHLKIRSKQELGMDFSAHSVEIEEIDKEIYNFAKKIDALQPVAEEIYICEKCNSKVEPYTKFCGSCGAPVVIPEKVEEALKICTSCNESIPASAVFCPCCGNATAEG